MLGKTRHVHFVGIGGIGMSGIAELLANLGYVVSGSDAKRSPVTERLLCVVLAGVLLEEMGRTLAPSPFFATSVLVASALNDSLSVQRALYRGASGYFLLGPETDETAAAAPAGVSASVVLLQDPGRNTGEVACCDRPCRPTSCLACHGRCRCVVGP